MNIGEEAPEFELKDQKGNNVSLRSFSGTRVLLAFFPFAFSPVCTEEMECFRLDMNEFKDMGIQILGVSVDSHWTLKAFSEKLGITLPLLSDFNKEVAKKYGVLRPDGFSERAYFLIDENRVIKYKHVMDSLGKKLDSAELLTAVKTL